MTAWAMVLLALALETPDINLLSNPSFERLNANGAAVSWSTFVEPKAGAFADLDPLANDGRWAALVHNPDPYKREPANNWSQVIVQDVAGRELVLSGYVRTEAATEAALWLQCFSRDPARVVAANSTSSAYSVSGTSEWQRVETQVSAPSSTDFVVVRCVLKGEGTAWFDDLLLVALRDTVPEFEVLEPDDAATSEAADSRTVERELSADELLEVSQMLQDAVRELRESNARLLERVTEIQSDLQEARMESLDTLEPMTPEIRHPLVPHDPDRGKAR